MKMGNPLRIWVEFLPGPGLHALSHEWYDGHMDSTELENVLREACNTPALCKLNTLVKELTGVGLLLVWSRGGGEYGQVPVCHSERDLPQFCRMLHEVPQGLRRCVTCHSLLALAACGRGQITEGRCHGGACVVASPVVGQDLPKEAEMVVISSCAFTQPGRRQGLRITRKFARDFGLDPVKLRHAYDSLPDLPAAKLKLVGEIVDTAAATLAEALHGRLFSGSLGDHTDPAHGIEDKLRGALKEVHAPEFRHVAGSTQATLVDVVQSVVGSNPQLAVTVADIARAAHITPNHFSLIFRRQTGITFSEFLAETRFERATEGLRDLTLSIAEVARQSGFPDPNYFAKVFHKRTGQSPRQWRLQNRAAVKRSKRPPSSAVPSLKKKRAE